MASAFVPQYAYDLFVSYAHVDNVPHPGNQAHQGWVTTLVDHLKMLLDEKLGRKDSAHVWMDHLLHGHEPFPDEIHDALKRAATLLVVISDGYLAADWCRREREAFLTAAGGEAGAAGRIFVVFRDEVPRQDVPAAFRDLLGYQFYEKEREGAVARTLGVPQPDPRERVYYQRLDDLRCDLARSSSRCGALRRRPRRAAWRGPRRPPRQASRRFPRSRPCSWPRSRPT